MRKVYVFDMTTVDGFFEGPNHDLGWHNVDEEFNEFAIDQLNETSTLLFGRVTYQLMADYWPTATAMKNDPVVARLMNSVQKVVFSTTLDETDWYNTRLVKEDAVREVTTFKREEGRDIGVLGSSQLAASLMSRGLIDEFRFMVNPVILGAGRPLFAGLGGKTALQLVELKAFASGNVLIRYRF